MSALNRQRLTEFDAMRGVAIVFVVYLHAYFSPWAVTPEADKVALHLIHLFAHAAVPVFLFISGFLLAREREQPFAAFLRRKAVRLGIPLLAWMLVALAYRAWMEGGIDHGLVKDFFLFNISGQFYYLFVLAIFYVVFFFVRGWPVRRLGWLAGVAFAVNLATIVYYQSSTISGDFATFAYRNPLAWVFAFSFGLYASRRWDSLEWTTRWLLPGLAGMAVLLAIYAWQGERGSGYPVSYFGVTVYLFACLGLVVFPGLTIRLGRARFGERLLAPARGLGRYAFAIYLVHMPLAVGFVTGHLVSNSPLQDDYRELMNGIFVVGLLSALAAVAAVDLFAPRVARMFLGVEPRTAAPRPPAAARLAADGPRA